MPPVPLEETVVPAFLLLPASGYVASLGGWQDETDIPGISVEDATNQAGGISHGVCR